MSVNRERKTLLVAQESTDFEQGRLSDVLTRVQYLIKQYGADAVVDDYSPPYDDSTYQYVYINVPETDEQMTTRIASEEYWEQDRLDREQREYERLKAKFGQ